MVGLLATVGEIHSFSCQTQELFNLKCIRKFFSGTGNGFLRAIVYKAFRNSATVNMESIKNYLSNHIICLPDLIEAQIDFSQPKNKISCSSSMVKNGENAI